MMARLVKLLPPLFDLGLVIIAYLLAFVLRFDGIENISQQHIKQFWSFLLFVPLLRLGCNTALGLYHHVWRYIGIRDTLGIVVATFAGSALFALLALMLGQHSFPRSVVGIEFLLSLVLFTGSRVIWRFGSEHRQHRSTAATRTLVVGAGDAGELLVRDMIRHPERGLMPVGFIDDAAAKRGTRIHGIGVLGDRTDLARLVAEQQIELIVLAMPSASRLEQRAILQLAAATPAQVKILPSLHDIIGGNVAVSQMRDVAIEDLLGRDPVVIDNSLLDYLAGKRVLVSGAGGSIGAELCRQIAKQRPARLLCLGHGENSIYHIDQELRASFPELELCSLIADIRDAGRIGGIFATHAPQLVFHAAAHKHVPLMETNETEAAANNIGGTQVLARTAAANGTERFVLISTDKAVNPTSIMGKTKRAAELLLQDLAGRSNTRFVAVRFGNVLGSRGSVVPLFRKQIEAGGPVTVTHPEMRRYFMTIPEAVTLVLQAADVGQ
ncbi:MAG: polysaccharide biosynthesis protein, partial [Cyanobacteria bacterium NC_groundwater_1444_Ag_S-0.65um_54_12]|nr:polysaccharide biosynthesis protein [Cyanobacteria bacterium NC_groundwater_1444_Ag_S-0.65um_54_12]